jgi:hypothetical protein
MASAKSERTALDCRKMLKCRFKREQAKRETANAKERAACVRFKNRLILLNSKGAEMNLLNLYQQN